MDAADWDDFAATYAAIQTESRLPLATDIVGWLGTWLPLEAMTALDLASGSGRYALPLAQRVKQITLLDWSANMLQLAAQALTARQLRNFTTWRRDWETLPATPVADLVFVSQLPGLTPAQLPRLQTLAGQALVINVQQAASNSLESAMAQALGQPPLPVSQVNQPLSTALQAVPVSRDFHYEWQEALSVSDLLPRFNRPFSSGQAAALASAVGAANANAMVPTTNAATFRVALFK